MVRRNLTLIRGPGPDWCMKEGSEGGEWKHLQKWARVLYSNCRSNARKRGLPFDLSKEQYTGLLIKTGGYCEVTGIPFSLQQSYKKGVMRPYRPSLDRVDCKRGYSTDNCRIVLTAVNVALGDWGLETLMEIATALVRDGGEPDVDPLPAGVGRYGFTVSVYRRGKAGKVYLAWRDQGENKTLALGHSNAWRALARAKAIAMNLEARAA